MYTRIAIMSLAICVCLGLAQINAHRPPLRDGGKVVVQVTPTAAPTSLLQLIRMSTLVVDGTVSSSLPVINTSQTPDEPRLETHSVVTVTAILSGAVPKSAGNILLAQVGGQLGKWDITVAGDPLVLPGERYILFLVPDERKELANTSGMPRCAATGVWSGKIKVKNGKVAFAAPSDPQLHSYDGTNVDTFLQMLKETIGRPYTNEQLPINFAPPKQSHQR